MENPIIAFDEAGNTGQNLLDPEQPIFVLASVKLSDSDADVLRDASGSRQELHFQRLRRSAKGRRRIIAALNSPLLATGAVKVTVIHKPFMVIGKIVDLLVEEIVRREGGDIYERGGNIGLANLMYFTTPTLCGPGSLEQLQRKFVQMIRGRAAADVESFYGFVGSLYRDCGSDGYKGILAMIFATRQVIDHVLRQVKVTTLDPAVPTFISLCAAWEEQLGRTFEIIHDESKPIAFDQELLELYMDSKATDQEMHGTDRRTMKVPFRATGINLADSAAVSQIQIADLVASSYAYSLNRHHMEDNDEFVASLLKTLLDTRTEWLIGGVWPTPEVDPQKLGTDGPTGRNLNESMHQFLQQRAEAKAR